MSNSPIFGRAVDEYHEARGAWLDLIHTSWLRAEEATRGNLLNRRGRELRVDPKTLFYGSFLRATAYASEELLDHWRETPTSRLPWHEFEKQFAREREANGCQHCQGLAS